MLLNCCCAMPPAFVFLAFIAAVSCSEWQYGDEDHWPELCRNGKMQSPIDIDPQAVALKHFDRFVFQNYSTEFRATIKNNGHSVQVNLQATEHMPRLTGGGLPREYTLDHLHFHWGSEHTFKGIRFPLEIHFVHYATGYGNLSDALNHKDGVAVLGVLCELSPDDDRHFEPLVKFVKLVEEDFNDGRYTNAIRIDDFLPRDGAGFYRYDGSLTTPNCNEVVTWTLFSHSIPISEEQMNYFENMKTPQGPLLHNYRPQQALEGRTVYYKKSPIRRSGLLGPVETCRQAKANSAWRLHVSCVLIVISLIAWW